MKRKLARARAKGRVTRRDAAAALSLRGHGLHPTQAVVGTGLLKLAEAQEIGFEMPNFGSVTPAAGAGRLLHIILRDADIANTHQIRIVPTGSEADIIFDNGGERRIPTAVLPALSLRAMRVGQRSGWHVHVFPAGIAPALQFVRQRQAGKRRHPADWSMVLDAFRESPVGLLVVVAPDAYVSRHYLAKFPVIQEIDNWRSVPSDRPALYDADLEDGRELALHAALAGRATVALMARSASDWWTPVADAGIPVRVIRSRLTALGPVWEAFHV
jgi:hypothetical protein